MSFANSFRQNIGQISYTDNYSNQSTNPDPNENDGGNLKNIFIVNY